MCVMGKGPSREFKWALVQECDGYGFEIQDSVSLFYYVEWAVNNNKAGG